MLSFSDLFWPMFAAMIASTFVWELFHVALSFYLTRRQMKRFAALQAEMAKQFPDGIPLDQMEFLSGGFPGGGFPGMKVNPAPPKGSGAGSGQYL